ncbi:T9SS type A sorting domain-containing protein [Flavobacterium sp.]|uniref:T9SS type A sorting domain-containing protein n=1 Tax=Flavobacterium sp. TaxID=239 RepID=UPI00286E45FD|nr:T9SS type A sorting domain-containing protein [Flavobacterium sp.]
MKTKITFQNVFNAIIALFLVAGLNANAQTYAYNETTSSGMFIDGDGAQVPNPVSDAVNSTANCAKSGTGGWKKIEYFPNYTPVTGSKLYFSIYNPNSAAQGQVKFEYTTGGGEQWGGNVDYVSGSLTGWKEYSVDLTSHIGNTINKIVIYPSGENAAAAFIDNIYFGTMSVLPQDSAVYNETVSSGMFIDGDGAQVPNPVSDAVNSTANCAKSGTGGWKKIEYFPNYTPVAGAKLYFSIYNPNVAGPGQVKFEYTTGGGEKWGGNVDYVSGSLTGWKEYGVDLTSHIGNTINKIVIYPSGENAAAAFIDNIYFGTLSALPQDPAVYNEITSSGMFFQGNGVQVTNPVKDTVNSSDNCAQSGSGSGWQQIQYFPTYAPVSGDKLYFSVYNPNNAGPGQLQFEYTSGGGWKWGGNLNYVSGSVTGWQEYSVDLTDHVGNVINKIIMMPAGDNSAVAYVDNIYFGTKSTLRTKLDAIINNQIYVAKDGKIQFTKTQSNTQLAVFDLTGRLILEENVNGVQSQNALNNKGIYIVRVKSDQGVSAQKIIF